MDRKALLASTRSAQKSDRPQSTETTMQRFRWLSRGNWGRKWVGIWAIAAAAVTAFDLGIGQQLEQQVQTAFFEFRGAIAPPEEVVILTIDDSSLAQGEFYRADPQKYADLAPIQAWPWQRTAYAIAIEKLMGAGAKAIALDVIFSTPSSYGDADDQRLAQTLQRYPDRIVLAAQYAESTTPQGFITQLITPLSRFCAGTSCTGFINFLVESDGRIHQQGEQFLRQLLQNSPPAQAEVLAKRPSFAQATLNAAQIDYPAAKGNTIFFYGPAQTFEHIPFWYVLDPTTWETNLQSGAYFKDKIVLIGATATSLQDFHPTPFAESGFYLQPMPGVEIHANAIATLLEGRTIAEAIPQAPWRGLFVLIGAAGAGWVLSRPQSPLRRLMRAIGLAALWTAASYLLFWQGRLILPTAIPVGAIALSGLSQLVVGTVKEQVRKQRLRDTLKQYVTSPIVQEIISQDDDLQDLLRERELALAGKILGGRYRISKVLGAGGFSETYVAEDLQRPGRPQCVVKQLKVSSSNANTLRLAQRLFITEAETLERLGRHDQIPQLLAHFEENNEFYLIQELVQGHPLSRELLPGRSLPDARVVQLLYDLLEVLLFVHQQGVIHRDLKPSNIMRRQADNKLVLIDFGVAKKITTQLAESGEPTRFTVPVGTPGYMSSEQSAGRPQFNSDLYALGMIGIEALTGLAPRALDLDAHTGAVIWAHRVNDVNPNLQMILNKMVHHDFMQRYQSVQEVQADLALFFDLPIAPEPSPNMPVANSHLQDGPVNELDTDEMANDTTIAWPTDWLNR